MDIKNNEIKKRKIGIFAVVILLTILLSSSVMALGVAIPYWDSPEWYPLKLAPGESKIVTLTLQNTEPEDMTLEASVEGEIASLTDRDAEYFVPSGEVNKPVSIRVEVPEDAKIGTRYKIYSSFRQISSGEGGMVRLAGALTVNFPVEVVGEEESELYGEEPQGISTSTTIMIVALAIIAILIVINAYVRKKKK